MAHEVGETVEREGRWVNVYGKSTPNAGKDLPPLFSYEQPSYASEAEAIAADKQRSQDWHYEELRPTLGAAPTPFGSFAADVLGTPPTRDFAAERAALAPRREAAEAKRQAAVGAVTTELD